MPSSFTIGGVAAYFLVSMIMGEMLAILSPITFVIVAVGGVIGVGVGGMITPIDDKENTRPGKDKH